MNIYKKANPFNSHIIKYQKALPDIQYFMWQMETHVWFDWPR